jgi:hypothetical protein
MLMIELCIRVNQALVGKVQPPESDVIPRRPTISNDYTLVITRVNDDGSPGWATSAACWMVNQG